MLLLKGSEQSDHLSGLLTLITRSWRDQSEQTTIGRRGFGSLHPWPSAQYRAYCLLALFLLRGIRRAALAQVTACRVVTSIDRHYRDHDSYKGLLAPHANI